MKKSAHVLPAIYLISLVLFASCGETTTSKIDEKVATKAPTQIITLPQAKEMYDAYEKRRVPLIQHYEDSINKNASTNAKMSPFEAARFVDFDYQTIKQYIAYIDQEAQRAGVKEITKLRLYFATYPDAKKFDTGEKVVHPSQNAVFMVPTLEMDNTNYAFYIGDNGKPELIIDWSTQLEDATGLLDIPRKNTHAGFIPNSSLNSNLQGGTSLVLNRGHGGPPPKTDF